MPKIKQQWSKEEYEKMAQIMIDLPEFEEDQQSKKWEAVSLEMFKAGFTKSAVQCNEKLI